MKIKICQSKVLRTLHVMRLVEFKVRPPPHTDHNVRFAQEIHLESQSDQVQRTAAWLHYEFHQCAPATRKHLFRHAHVQGTSPFLLRHFSEF
jgi:hypothetical protein